MGNCTGLFSSCEGKDGQTNAIKKVNKDKIQEALNHNKNLENFNQPNFEESQTGKWNDIRSP